MSRAQGQFTIIDYNDALTLTGYIGSNHPKTQMYNPDNGSYTPNWASTNLVLTPSLYIIGTTTDQITSENVTWKTQQGPRDWKRSVFIPIPKKGNAIACSNYHTTAFISHASKVMLKTLQARLQQYLN